MSTPAGPLMKPPPHRRLTFEGIFGTLLAPVEEWSFRLTLAPNIVEDGNDAAVTSAASAWTTHIAPLCRPTARLTRVKLARIGADGLYTDDPTVKDVDTAGTSAATAILPLQVALAISLTTARRGATGRGRIFLPAPGLSNLNATDGLISVPNQTQFATAAAAFIQAINGAPRLGNVVIASSKGYLTTVNGVRVGRVPDVIRSRRSKLQEVYAAPVAVSAVSD